MPHALTSALLQGGKAIIPFEEIGGGRQVSSVVVHKDGKYVSYSLVDDEAVYLGPIGLVKADVSSENIEAWLATQQGKYESLVPSKVNITESSFLLNGSPVTVIEGIDVVDGGGRILQLRREGAAYPYGLVLSS